MNRPIANNGLIVSNNDGQLGLACVSSQSALGVIMGLDGNMFTGNSVWRVGHPYDRPGVRRLRTNDDTSLTAADQGIYTCTVPDNDGNQIVINVGLYPTGFSGEKQYFRQIIVSHDHFNSYRESHHQRPDLSGGRSYSDMCVHWVSSHHCLLDEGWTTSHH